MNKTISGPQMKVPTKGVLSTLKKKDPQSLIDIRAAMNKVIFPYIKFVPKERLMSIAPKSIGATVCGYLGISDKDVLNFWSTRYLIAYAEFSHHKTRVSRCVKEAFQTSMLFDFLIVSTSIVANHFVFFFFDKQILSNTTQVFCVSMIKISFKQCLIMLIMTSQQSTTIKRHMLPSSKCSPNVFWKELANRSPRVMIPPLMTREKRLKTSIVFLRLFKKHFYLLFLKTTYPDGKWNVVWN